MVFSSMVFLWIFLPVVMHWAAQHLAESRARLDILEKEGDNPILPAYQARPDLLYFSDISTDKDEWVNVAMAEYYHKKSVCVQP